MRYFLFTMFAILICAIGTVRNATASNAKGIYTILGAGTSSCGSWTANRPYDPGPSPFVSNQHINDLLTEEAWLLGYITSYNSSVWKGDNVASETDRNGIFAWVDTYCAAHPTTPLAGAAEDLVDFLSKGPHPNSKP